MCLFFIIYILLLGKPSLIFFFGPISPLVDFFPFRSPRHHRDGELHELADDTLSWRPTKTVGNFPVRPRGSFQDGSFRRKVSTRVTSSNEMEKNQKQGGVMKGMKLMHAPSWRVWIERFGLWKMFHLSQMLHGTGRFTYRFAMKIRYSSR